MKKIISIIIFSLFLFDTTTLKIKAAEFSCGQLFTLPMFSLNDCGCSHYDFIRTDSNPPPAASTQWYCCGWYLDNTCNATADLIPTPTPTLRVKIPNVDKDLLNTLNPLKNYSTKADQLSTPGGIISEILTYAFPIAGVILFVMLIMAGFKMLTGASNSSSTEEGKKMISTAVIGFIILFAAYWIAQLIEIIFGIRILGVQQLN